MPSERVRSEAADEADKPKAQKGAITCVASHSIDLPSGRSIAPGESGDVDDVNDPLVATLVEDGLAVIA